MEMDREFLQELRELKQILDKDSYDELKSNILIPLRVKLPERIYSELDSNFKVLLFNTNCLDFCAICLPNIFENLYFFLLLILSNDT